MDAVKNFIMVNSNRVKIMIKREDKPRTNCLLHTVGNKLINELKPRLQWQNERPCCLEDHLQEQGNYFVLIHAQGYVTRKKNLDTRATIFSISNH